MDPSCAVTIFASFGEEKSRNHVIYRQHPDIGVSKQLSGIAGCRADGRSDRLR